MPITEILERNAKLWPDDVALTELNPKAENKPQLTWREFSLIESTPGERYRRQLTWSGFDRKANRMANLLLARGVKKGDKIAVLLMNCLEWLPIYFGILKTGAMAVPKKTRDTGMPMPSICPYRACSFMAAVLRCFCRQYSITGKRCPCGNRAG